MSMSKSRDLYRQVAEREKPEATKKRRPAPKPSLTRSQAVKREKDKKKSTAWKLSPDTKPAIDRAAAKHGVGRGELVDFLLRAGLRLLATGRIELPVKKAETVRPQYTIEPQSIPDDFLE